MSDGADAHLDMVERGNDMNWDPPRRKVHFMARGHGHPFTYCGKDTNTGPLWSMLTREAFLTGDWMKVTCKKCLRSKL